MWGFDPADVLPDDLTGVLDLSGIADGDTLVWDAALGLFVPGTGGGGGGGGGGAIDKVVRTTNASSVDDYGFTSTSWAAVDATNLVLSVPAATGDRIEVGFSARIDNEAKELYLDAGTIVGGSLVNFASGQGTGGTTRGVQAWTGLISAVSHAGGSIIYTAQAGDISAAAIALRLYGRINAAGTKTINARSTIPIHFWCHNLGQ